MEANHRSVNSTEFIMSIVNQNPAGVKTNVMFFCADRAVDPVAMNVFDVLDRLCDLSNTETIIDGYPVKQGEDSDGNRMFFVRTADVLSHDYPRYLPWLESEFSTADFSVLVNWHSGARTQERLFTIHTTGDVASGMFGAAHPVYTRNLWLALERFRVELGLEEYVSTGEATHWSGIPYGGNPTLIGRYPVPLVDIEIGSGSESWSDPRAAEVLARSLLETFQLPGDHTRAASLLCMGGVHLEPNYTQAVLNNDPDHPFSVTHVIANHAAVAGGYDSPSGIDRLRACAASIIGGVDALIFHDDLKGRYKAPLRDLAEELAIPLIKYKSLRQPGDLPLWG